jgi:rod shape-determining protein MreD
MRYIVATVVLCCLAALQVSVVSRLSFGAAAPQFVVLSVIAWSLLRGPMEGMFWGFIGGLWFDLASGGPVGISALALLAVAAVTGTLGGRMFGSNPVLPVIGVFVSTAAYFLIVSFLLATLHHRTDWEAVLRDVALPTAIANGILAVVVYPMLAFIAAHTSRRVRVEF